MTSGMGMPSRMVTPVFSMAFIVPVVFMQFMLPPMGVFKHSVPVTLTIGAGNVARWLLAAPRQLMFFTMALLEHCGFVPTPMGAGAMTHDRRTDRQRQQGGYDQGAERTMRIHNRSPLRWTGHLRPFLSSTLVQSS